MSSYIAPKKYTKLDMAPMCRNYTQDADGFQRRMGNNSTALRALADAVNNLAAKQPRPMFTQAWLYGARDSNNLDPSIVWKYSDKVKNGRNHRYTIVSAPPADGAGHNMWASRYPNHDFSTTNMVSNLASFSKWQDLQFDDFIANRGNETNAEVSFGLTTQGGITILSMGVWDEPLPLLDTSVHTYCDPIDPKAKGKVLANSLENIRAAFHKIRSENLPIVLCWSAFGTSASTNAPGNQYGITIDSNTYLNIFDQSDQDVTARTASSVGACFNGRYSGRGLEGVSGTSGDWPKIQCRVYAYVSKTSGATPTGTVKFSGSECGLGTENKIEISVTDLTPTWYGTSTDFIYLYPLHDSSTFHLDMNKIDVLGKISADGVDPRLSILGVVAWVEYW